MDNTEMIPIALLTIEHVPEKALCIFVYIEVEKGLVPLKIKDHALMLPVLSIFSFL